MDGGSDTPEAPLTVVGGGAAGTPVASRWNPTKEQINMLENLYRQGLRTPTAEQIQEITGRLQTYGHIEGKNVFYWFQNHKARQRQKEKQDHMSLFRQYNHHHRLLQPPPLFVHLSPPPNVVYVPQNVGFYVPQPQVVSPNTTTSSNLDGLSPRSAKPGSVDTPVIMSMHQPENAIAVARGSNMMSSKQDDIVTKNNSHQETLDLFPMHPTGILQEAVDTAGNGGCLASRACTSSLSGGAVDRVYFDFFC